MPGFPPVDTKLAAGWTAEKLFSTSPRGKSFLSIAKRPDQLWGPSSLLFNGYWDVFPHFWKLSPFLDVVPRSRMSGAIDVLLLPHTHLWRSQGAIYI